jgi:ketosteroid isomerase-like protein
VGPDEQAVRQANQEFYRAFESLELGRMESAWAHEGQVTCIHPGWPLAAGWSAVRDSWRTIFGNTERIRFEVTDEQVEVGDELAWVVCTEWLASRSAAGANRGAVLATNVFRRVDGAWRMVHHHASPFLPRSGDEPSEPPPMGRRGPVN